MLPRGRFDSTGVRTESSKACGRQGGREGEEEEEGETEEMCAGGGGGKYPRARPIEARAIKARTVAPADGGRCTAEMRRKQHKTRKYDTPGKLGGGRRRCV